MKKSKKIDLGDFQTPIPLTDRICRYISSKGFKPQILIEPTCGMGNFVFSAIKYFPTLKTFKISISELALFFFNPFLSNYILHLLTY